MVGHPSSDGVTIKIPFGADVYYVGQTCTDSFLIELVKAESNFIVRSADTWPREINTGGTGD